MENYEYDVVNDIIIPIDEKRKTWLGMIKKHKY